MKILGPPLPEISLKLRKTRPLVSIEKITMARVSSTSASSTSVSLKEYLKRYQNPSEDHQNKKESKKKKKKKEAKVIDVRVRVVDEDPVWQKPQNLEEEDEAHDSSG